MSKSQTTTDASLPNPHPGADLRADLFEELGVSIDEAALATGLSIDAIEGFLNGSHRVNAEFDLRLGRYFGFSPGYFLRLQNAHDLDAAKRAAGSEIARIQPRIQHAA